MTRQVPILVGDTWKVTPGIPGRTWSATKAWREKHWTITHNKSGMSIESLIPHGLTRSEAYVAATVLNESGFDVSLPKMVKSRRHARECGHILEALIASTMEIKTCG